MKLRMSFVGLVVLAASLTAACGGMTANPAAPTEVASLAVSPAQTQQGGTGGGGGCTLFNDFKVSSGFTPSSNSSFGAVWVQWKLNSCPSPSGQGIAIQVKLTDSTAHTLLYTVPGMLAQQLIDFDNLKTGNAYHVDWTVSDAGTGAPLISRTADVVTPSHNGAGI